MGVYERVCVSPLFVESVKDVAVTCEECQKRKIHGFHVKPPVLKIDMKEPFEM